MSKTLLRLALQSQGIPVVSVAGPEPPYTIGYDESATPEQIAAGNAIALSYTDPPEPNRSGFRLGLTLDPDVQSVLSQNPAVAAVLVNTLDKAMDDPALLPDVKALWDALVGSLALPLTDAQRTNIMAIATNNNVTGIALNDDGTMNIG